ncbi:MAG TPA: hypothetical protein PLG50_06490 [bacterium]|nr:hypothetical protein [bacterium]HQG45287.1 hypothetical protein [bacterium]HQI50287.1 hypothetical protein [bacterium]HQJ65185.1 hypothetical protein [bacterium]
MIPQRRASLPFLLFILLFSVVSRMAAQPAMLQRSREGAASAGAVFQLWKVEDDQARQIAFPVTFLYPVNEQTQLSMAMGPAFSTVESTGSAALNGFSDTRFSGSYLFKNEKLLATFGLNLPSGKSALNTEELAVANILALHAFDFTSPILGQGLDVSAGMVSAFPLAGMVAGLGAGFLLRGGFEPYENGGGSYNPGEEITLSASVDYPLSHRQKLMLDAGYTLYTADKVGSAKVFQAGNRLTLQAMAWFPGSRAGLLLLIRDRIRAKNKFSSGEALIPERQNSNGNELELSATVTVPRGAYTTLRGVVEGKVYSNNAYEIGGATIGGFGAGLSKTFSPHVSFELDARLYVGSLKTEINSVHLTGLKTTGGLKFRL